MTKKQDQLYRQMHLAIKSANENLDNCTSADWDTLSDIEVDLELALVNIRALMKQRNFWLK